MIPSRQKSWWPHHCHSAAQVAAVGLCGVDGGLLQAGMAGPNTWRINLSTRFYQFHPLSSKNSPHLWPRIHRYEGWFTTGDGRGEVNDSFIRSYRDLRILKFRNWFEHGQTNPWHNGWKQMIPTHPAGFFIVFWMFKWPHCVLKGTISNTLAMTCQDADSDICDWPCFLPGDVGIPIHICNYTYLLSSYRNFTTTEVIAATETPDDQ